MNIPRNKEGLPCCTLCEKDFRGGKLMISVIYAGDTFFFSDPPEITIRNSTDIKLFHRDCFSEIAGEDWWKNPQ